MTTIYRSILLLSFVNILLACESNTQQSATEQSFSHDLVDSLLIYEPYEPQPDDIVISRHEYQDRLYGFWLAQCIANWTGLVTEMDKIGGAGKDGRAAGFYTSEDWGKLDQRNLWGNFMNDGLSDSINFVFIDEGDIWGADDDTDIEYIYQHLMYTNQTSKLTAQQIRDGWLKHIYSDDNSPFFQSDGKTKENYLWVSNQTAHDLMRKGMLPPETSLPENNPHYEMIDAQLTTEIFGFFAPTRPDVAIDIAQLPIQTTAQYNAQWISEFYVIMYALASKVDANWSNQEKTQWMASQARKRLPEKSYAAKMYDFVKAQYERSIPWEAARDSLYEKYQVREEDGYEWATKDPSCYGCFSAGINFGASIVSLLYGEGDLKKTIQIGTLAGWDSDNPTATWGGLLGFMLGKSGVEQAFDRKFSDQFNIHRTRGGFANDGIDNFEHMAKIGVFVTDRVVQERLGGGVDLEQNVWYIPKQEINIPKAPL